MKKFVLITGILNIVSGLLFTMPDALVKMGFRLPDTPFWLLFPAIFMVFLGFILVFCSRDLEHRATIVLWDGLSRVAAFLSFLGFVLFGGMGADIMPGAAVDLIIGIVYFIGLPRLLNRGFLSILFDSPVRT